LFFSDAADVSFCVADGAEKFSADLFTRGFDFALRNPKPNTSKLYSVELFCPRRQRSVAAFAHISNDSCGDALGFAIALVASAEKMFFDGGSEFQDSH
jgi:hypothetical protein